MEIGPIFFPTASRFYSIGLLLFLFRKSLYNNKFQCFFDGVKVMLSIDVKDRPEKTLSGNKIENTVPYRQNARFCLDRYIRSALGQVHGYGDIRCEIIDLDIRYGLWLGHVEGVVENQIGDFRMREKVIR